VHQRDLAEVVRERQAEDDASLEQVGPDQQPPLALLGVHPRPDDEGQEVRSPHGGREQTDRRRAGVQHRHGDERQGQLGDPVAELGDGLTTPVRRESAVAPQRIR